MPVGAQTGPRSIACSKLRKQMQRDYGTLDAIPLRCRICHVAASSDRGSAALRTRKRRPWRNRKSRASKVSSAASKVLKSKTASKAEKSVAASALTQTKSVKETTEQEGRFGRVQNPARPEGKQGSQVGCGLGAHAERSRRSSSRFFRRRRTSGRSDAAPSRRLVHCRLDELFGVFRIPRRRASKAANFKAVLVDEDRRRHADELQRQCPASRSRRHRASRPSALTSSRNLREAS